MEKAFATHEIFLLDFLILLNIERTDDHHHIIVRIVSVDFILVIVVDALALVVKDFHLPFVKV